MERGSDNFSAFFTAPREITKILFSRLVTDRKVTIEDLQGENAMMMPSSLLENMTRQPPQLFVLLKYSDCVIQADYKGIIEWGICDYATSDSLANVFEMLSAWHGRVQEPDTIEAFERELISQLKQADYSSAAFRTHIVPLFPHLQHDMTHLDLIFGADWMFSEHADDGDRLRFGQRLMTDLDLKEETDCPSLITIVVRSFLKAVEMSKYGGGRFSEQDLRALYEWLELQKEFDKDSFCADVPTLLLLLLQNSKLETSQLVEIDTSCEIGGVSRFNDDHPWRQILKMLTEEETLQQKDWNHRQLPLHMLLSRGLPGQDILVKHSRTDSNKLKLDANKKVDHVGIKCPIEGLYPFQIAATSKDYGPGFVDASEETRRFLDQEQLSQVYSLMRADPSRVVESHPSHCSAERGNGKAAAKEVCYSHDCLDQVKRPQFQLEEGNRCEKKRPAVEITTEIECSSQQRLKRGVNVQKAA